MPNVYEPLVLEIEPPYIGSAFSPTVDIDETADDITVTITDSRGEHSYTVEKTDQAIADAEAAAANANQAASDVQSAVDAASTAATRANNAASAAETATVDTQSATLAANAAASDAQSATSTANTAASNADAKAALANTAASNADEKAALADDAAENADAKAALADTAATAANTAAADASTAAASANTAAQEATEAAESITDGRFPMMTAGMADALFASDATLDTFAQRTSDHDGGVRIESLRGNTVRWNQLCTPNMSSRTYNGITFTNNNDGSITVNGTASGNAFTSKVGSNIPAGHKFILKGCPGVGSPETYSMYMTGVGITPQTVRDIGYGAIGNVTTGEFNLVIYVANGITVNDIVFYPQYIDLTAMFGAGNEPATVEEFERQYPADYYPYDAGSLLSVNVEGIESAGVTREIPAATYFPDGMRSTGSVYDELTSDKAVTRIGSVDLGTLNWSYDSASKRFQTGEHPIPVKPVAGPTDVGNLLSSAYSTASGQAQYNDQTLDMTISLGAGSGSILRVRNLAYTDAATFKAAMSGVMLYYELATPIETTIDPPLNLAYPTEQGGTESIVIPTGEMSAPPTFVYVQGYDANGVADRALSVIAPLEGAKASTNYAIGGYFVHAGELYRATSAIATGETITPGTNCVATTVMDEIVRLTA